MELKIKELCDQRGIKSAYALAQAVKKAGKSDESKALNMPTAYRAFANDIKQFTIETLESLCAALECSPNDIFGVQSAQNKPVAVSESVKRESVKVAGTKAIDGENYLVIDGENYLSTKQVAERIGRKPRTVIDLFKKGKLDKIKRGQENFVAESVLKSFINSQSGI